MFYAFFYFFGRIITLKKLDFLTLYFIYFFRDRLMKWCKNNLHHTKKLIIQLYYKKYDKFFGYFKLNSPFERKKKCTYCYFYFNPLKFILFTKMISNESARTKETSHREETIPSPFLIPTNFDRNGFR